MNRWIIMALLLCCSLSSKAQNSDLKSKDTNAFIRYLTFPALDSLITELYPSVREAKYPMAILKRIEGDKPNSEIYSIYIQDFDHIYERNARLGEYTSVQMLSNRFVMINHRKIPIYFEDFDHCFYAFDPRDSLFKWRFEMSVWHGYIVYFDMRSREILKITR